MEKIYSKIIELKSNLSQSVIRHNAGASLVEVLVAIGITSIMLPALLSALVSANAAKPAAQQQILAAGYLRSLTEETRSIREKGWTNISTNGTYHPETSGDAWEFASGTATTGNFTVQVVISDVQRDSSGAVVSNGGTVDPNTKLATATVSWNKPISSSISSNAYFTRWQNDATWSQTNQAEFIGGTLSNTATTNSSGGEVQLTPDWSSPSLSGNLDISGNAGISSASGMIGGTPYAFIGYTSGMALVNVSNPAAPSLAGTYATSSAVNDIYISGTSAYLALAGSSNQFVIVDISNPASPSTTGSLTVGGTIAANAVTVSGSTAYIVSDTASGSDGDFNIVDISNPSAPSLTGKLKIGSDNTGVVVSGNYAYISTDTASAQLEAVNVSNPASPTAGNTINLGANGTGIARNDSEIYVSTQNNASSGELRIFSVSTPGTMASVGDYEVGGSVNGLAISGNDVLLATGVAAKQLISVNITTPSSPTLGSNVSLSTAANNVSTDGFYAYTASADVTKGLQIINGGPKYNASGTFESGTFDAGSNAGFNGIDFSADQPGGSTVKLQVASNNDNSTWNYIGPDGTNSTYFTSANAIPLTAANGRYFRYKAFFSAGTGNISTALLLDVTLNYSP